MTLIEKRREKIPERCGEPHPTEEWFRVEGGEYVYFASTCYLSKGHAGAHRCISYSVGSPEQDWSS